VTELNADAVVNGSNHVDNNIALTEYSDYLAFFSLGFASGDDRYLSLIWTRTNCEDGSIENCQK